MKKFYLLIIIIALACFGWWAIDNNLLDTRPIFSVSSDGKMIYHNSQFSFDLELPKGWRMGNDRLGTGTTQFFSYPESAADAKSIFGPDQNKIEARISDLNYDQECESASRFLCRFIPIPNSNRFISFVIYGDQDNFPILDNVISSLTWTKK